MAKHTTCSTIGLIAMRYSKNIENTKYKTWEPLRFRLDIHGLSTAFYGPEKFDAEKKTLLLIHGIGGDYHGFKPFAYDLRLKYNVYIVDLPGHGLTDTPSDRSYDFWKKWAVALLPELSSNSIVIDEVVAHSFGCLVASFMDLRDTPHTMITPVTHTTKVYIVYTKVIYNLRYLIAPWYGIYAFAALRGIMLSYRRERGAMDVIRWVSKNAHYSMGQFVYQAALARDIDEYHLFGGLDTKSSKNLRIIMASHDSFSTEDYFDLKREIPNVNIKLVSGGHLVPMEAHEELAKELYG